MRIKLPDVQVSNQRHVPDMSIPRSYISQDGKKPASKVLHTQAHASKLYDVFQLLAPTEDPRENTPRLILRWKEVDQTNHISIWLL